MTSELKPCPFCGGEAEVVGTTGYSVICYGCQASVGKPFDGNIYDGVFSTEWEAIDAWNQRAERICKRLFVPSEGVMKCDNCMTNLNPDWWNYCPNCGAKVVE